MSAWLSVLIPALAAAALNGVRLYAVFGRRRPFGSIRTAALFLVVCSLYGVIAGVVTVVAGAASSKSLQGIVGVGTAAAIGSAEQVGTQRKERDGGHGRLLAAVGRVLETLSDVLTGRLDAELIELRMERCRSLKDGLIVAYASHYQDRPERAIPLHERLFKALDTWLATSSVPQDAARGQLRAVNRRQDEDDRLSG